MSKRRGGVVMKRTMAVTCERNNDGIDFIHLDAYIASFVPSAQSYLLPICVLLERQACFFLDRTGGFFKIQGRQNAAAISSCS